MPITQTDIDLVLSNRQHSHIKFLVYDESDTLLDELTGFATSFTWNNLSDSDIRRTANVTMYVPDKSYLVESSSVVWLDNKVKIYVGLENAAGAITWYIVGTYLFSDSSYTFNETTQEMSITLIDMMACTTEKRGSQINGYGLTIPAGENVRNAIISVITGFTPYHQYSIPEFPDVIPYDLEFSIGVYPYEVLKTILGLFPSYEMYYDEDGVFTVAEIPTGLDDDIFLTEDIISELVISETKSSSFSNVRNVTELMGRSLEADYTATSCTTCACPCRTACQSRRSSSAAPARWRRTTPST